MTAPILTTAKQLGRTGLRVFFCLEDKRPACPHGYKDAACDPAALHDLHRRYPGPLIGAATGEVSGVDALDLDKKHVDATEWWSANRHRIPRTRVHRTRSGGLHVLFQHKSSMRCWAGRPVVGIDGRCTGGYIIWWPAAGLPVLCDAAPAPWPDWLLAELSAARPDHVSTESVVSWRPPGDSAGSEEQMR